MKKPQIAIKWMDFESVSSSLFKDLRHNGDFFDVTLACDDAQFRAHRALLAACSKDFFLKILRQSVHDNPYIYLKGVKSEILLSVLNFVYNGEVELLVDQLDSFFEVAEDLSIKGLTEFEFRKNGFKRHEIIHLVKTSSKSKNGRTQKVQKVRNKKHMLKKKGSKKCGRSTSHSLITSKETVDVNDNRMSSPYPKEKSPVEDNLETTDGCDGPSLVECEKLAQIKRFSDQEETNLKKQELSQKKVKRKIFTEGN